MMTGIHDKYGCWVTCVVASVVWATVLAEVLPAATVVANVGQDYVAGTTAGVDTSATVGIPDTEGTGTWNYYQANGGGGSPALLIWNANPGNSGQPGYGSTAPNTGGFDVPALSKNLIFGDGVAAPSDEVNVHPGNVDPVEVIARWTAGASGLMNIAGSFDENGGAGDIGFAVRVNGTDVFNGTTTREDGFSFLQAVSAGDAVDFVVGPNGGFGGDESQLNARATRLSGTLLANAGGDYTGSGQPFADTFGTGQWSYFESDNVNIDATVSEQALTFKSVGNAGNNGYGGSGSAGMGAISDAMLFVDGEAPLADELAWHPSDGFLQYTVARWTAGAGEAGMVDITGNIRNVVVGGDGIDFHILVDGSEVFTLSGTGSSTPITFFDVSAAIGIGSTIDFVLGRDGGTFSADESIFSAFITQTSVVPEPMSISLLGLGLFGVGWFGWRRRR